MKPDGAGSGAPLLDEAGNGNLLCDTIFWINH
jgi:hypothetical protein